ncbi:MAG: PCRF domain-containing protein, partial [Thermodesulfobacteriota bacterium]
MVEHGVLKRLEEVEKKYEEIERVLSDPSISPTEIHRYSKERSEISDIVEIYRQYKETLKEIDENQKLIEDRDLAELAREEITALEDDRDKL